MVVAGTELFRDSVTMWQMKLQVLIDSKSPDVAALFEEAFVHLKPQVCESGLLYFILFGKTAPKAHLERTCLMRAGSGVHFLLSSDGSRVKSRRIFFHL